MKNVIFGLLLMAASSAVGQHKLSGLVTDKNSQEPVIGATVQIQNIDFVTGTDIDGNFLFNDLPAGNYLLIISSLGFESRSVKVSLPQQTSIEIELTTSAIEMEEVIISTPFHRLQSENVMKVERISLQELARSGGTRLTDGISQLPGVETITTGSSIGKPVIRGLSSNRVLVYTQGVRLENQQFGDEHGLGLSSSGVESVEVIKGPASLLYGSDALGGVLYINPERFAPQSSTLLDAQTQYYSNTEGFEANAGIKTSGEKFKYLFRGNIASHSDYKTGDGNRVTNSRFRENDLKAGAGYQNNNYKGDLRYNLNSSATGIPEEIGLQTTSKSKVQPYQEVENHILSLDNTLYFTNSSLNFKIGALYNNRKEFENHHHKVEHEDVEEHEEHEEVEEHEEHANEPALEMHLKTLNYDIKYHLPESKTLETIIGIQGMFQKNKNLGEEILIPDASTADIGILATTHYHLEKWDFQAGLRYDHRKITAAAFEKDELVASIPALDRSFNSFNGALGVKVNAGQNFTARLNIATGFRAPNLAELTSYGSHHGTNRFEIGNADLSNEQNYQLDLALEYKHEHVEFFGNAFYNKVNNYIFLNPTGDFLEDVPVFNYLQNNAALYGGEAGLHLHPHWLHWLHFRSSYELVIGELDNGENLPLIPAQSVLNNLLLELPQMSNFTDNFLSLSIKSVFDQNNTGNFETATGGYSLVNAGIGSSLNVGRTVINLKVTGDNLLNKTYLAHLSRLKPLEIPNMGRSVIFSAGIEF